MKHNDQLNNEILNNEQNNNEQKLSNEENNFSNRSQGTNSENEIKVEDTDRYINKNSNFFTTLCGTAQKNEPTNDKSVKTLSESLDNYFDSEELKEELQNIGVPKDKFGSVTKKLKEYSEKYSKQEINLDRLKEKFDNYFKRFKSENQKVISKDSKVSEGIDNINNHILSYISEEEEKHMTMTFGGLQYSPRQNENQNNNDKSYLEIPHLNISAIYNPELEQENQFSGNSQNTNENIDNLMTSPNNNKFINENNNREEEQILDKNYDKMSGGSNETNRSGDEKFEIIKEDSIPKTNTTELPTKFVEPTSNEAEDRLKIKTYIKIYESTFGYKISPTTEDLIVNLVLETEKYVKKIINVIENYETKLYIKNKILEALNKPTDKVGVLSTITELNNDSEFKTEDGKKVLEFAQKQIQTQIETDGWYSKIIGKFSNAYSKLEGKLYGYTKLSQKQIDEIAEYAYKRFKEPDDKIGESGYKRKIFNNDTKDKLLNSNDESDNIKAIDEFIKSKGYTIEADTNNIDFFAIDQYLREQEDIDADNVGTNLESSHCDGAFCHAMIAATAILFAMQYVTSYSDEGLYHGFGPSGGF